MGEVKDALRGGGLEKGGGVKEAPGHQEGMVLSDTMGTQLMGMASTDVPRAITNNTLSMTVADLRGARETRAGEALKMKDQQLRMLQEQNTELLGNLDRVEEEAARIQQERLVAEDENRNLREGIFEAQSRARAAETTLKKVQADSSDRDKQIRILTDQNAELLRLLEAEEASVGKLVSDREVAVADLEALRAKYSSLLMTAKQHEELAGRATREGQVRAEEVRVLRAEADQLRAVNAELRMKTQVELESLQEALRVRKEKQYQLLERLQGQESVARQSEDQVTTMEEKIRAVHAKNMELDTQLQVESQRRKSSEEAGRAIAVDLDNERRARQELQGRLSKADEERLRMEAEARDSGEQLREMAEKVFQLLERLKLAEMAKGKALEALRFKDSEMAALKKKNERLVKESVREGRTRVKAELDLSAAQEQSTALKKQNAQLAAKCRDEAKARLKEHEDRVGTQEKVRTLGGRLSFLLNKMQADEESKVIMQEEARKMDAQLRSLNARIEELQVKLEEAGESNRVITQALRLKQGELEELTVKYGALQKQIGRARVNGTLAGAASEGGIEGASSSNALVDSDGAAENSGAAGDMGPADPESIKANGGRGVFHLESKPSQGLVLVRGRRAPYREWLEKRDVNGFLRRAQRTPQRFKEMIVERLCQTYALLMAEETQRIQREADLEERGDQLRSSERKSAHLQKLLATEEDAKRRTLLRYIHAVKASAGVGGKGCVITLPEAGIGDEEMHAIAALLRGSTSIAELGLRGNSITDEGARALAAVLCGKCAIRSVDLRGNQISKQGVRALAEALERSDRVRHVYVHAGGKIEALGTNIWETSEEKTGDGDASEEAVVPLVTVETICIVDVRQNTPPEGQADMQQLRSGKSTVGGGGIGPAPLLAVSLGRSSSVKQYKATKSIKGKPKRSSATKTRAWAEPGGSGSSRAASLSPAVSRSQELARGSLPGIAAMEGSPVQRRADTAPRTKRRPK
jgi:hypothetical protein